MNFSIAREPNKSKKNILIAESLGWSVYSHWVGAQQFFVAVAPHERVYSAQDYAQLVKMGGDYARRITEESAWKDAPDYMGDMDAAESALDPKDDLIFAVQDDDTYSCEILRGHDKETSEWEREWLGEGKSRIEAFGNALYERAVDERMNKWVKRVAGSKD